MTIFPFRLTRIFAIKTKKQVIWLWFFFGQTLINAYLQPLCRYVVTYYYNALPKITKYVLARLMSTPETINNNIYDIGMLGYIGNYYLIRLENSTYNDCTRNSNYFTSRSSSCKSCGSWSTWTCWEWWGWWGCPWRCPLLTWSTWVLCPPWTCVSMADKPPGGMGSISMLQFRRNVPQMTTEQFRLFFVYIILDIISHWRLACCLQRCHSLIIIFKALLD